jgi:hypothetical protein
MVLVIHPSYRPHLSFPKRKLNPTREEIRRYDTIMKRTDPYIMIHDLSTSIPLYSIPSVHCILNCVITVHVFIHLVTSSPHPFPPRDALSPLLLALDDFVLAIPRSLAVIYLTYTRFHRFLLVGSYFSLLMGISTSQLSCLTCIARNRSWIIN